MADVDVSEFFNELKNLVYSVEHRNKNDKGEVYEFCQKLQIGLENLSSVLLLVESPSSRTSIQSSIDCLLLILQELQRETTGFNNNLAIIDYTPDKVLTGNKGRPKYEISEEMLLYFRDLGYPWKEIASMLCVSRWTVSRRVKELGLNEVTGYSDISDDELQNIITSFKNMHGNFIGRSLTIGHLKSIGIRVQQKRVADILRKIDPENGRLRWASLVRRRKYSVPGPNSLWHIDGHHSLINWKFVIHGGIDGFSRLIVYLRCCTNNRKETVVELFDESIEAWGIPSRVRSDKGGENVLVWDRMTQYRGEHRGSYLAGSSVHNQRIERLWRDVWTYVCYQFYYTFQAMENQGILDMSNTLHVFVLHFVFLPRINHVIESFISGWNNHPLRTEKNWSPRRLWENGVNDKRNRSQIQISELFGEDVSHDDLEWYGMDWSAPTPNDDGLSTVTLDDVIVQFPDDGFQILNTVNPKRESASFGIDIYLDVLSLLDIN